MNSSNCAAIARRLPGDSAQTARQPFLGEETTLCKRSFSISRGKVHRSEIRIEIRMNETEGAIRRWSVCTLRVRVSNFDFFRNSAFGFRNSTLHYFRPRVVAEPVAEEIQVRPKVWATLRHSVQRLARRFLSAKDWRSKSETHADLPSRARRPQEWIPQRREKARPLSPAWPGIRIGPCGTGCEWTVFRVEAERVQEQRKG